MAYNGILTYFNHENLGILVNRTDILYKNTIDILVINGILTMNIWI